MTASSFEPLAPESYRDLVRRALAEDIGPGDVTTRATVDPSVEARAVLLAKSRCVLAGLDVAVEAFRQLDPDAAERLFPALSDAPKGIDLYAVLGADGTPIALTDSRNAAIANAIENDLVPVSVH